MSHQFDQPKPIPLAPLAAASPVVVPIDEAVAQHISQVYWDWRAAFDHDPLASPLQHPDYVLAELAAGRTTSPLQPVAILEDSDRDQPVLGILIPKMVRTSIVGGIGPSWTLHGLRLAGGRFLGERTSVEQQRRLLRCVVQYAAAYHADFLLIEDLDQQSVLFQAAHDRAFHEALQFATHESQPRRYIDFPSTAEDYWQTFSSRSLSKFRRNLKKFGKTRLERVTSIEQIPDFLKSAHDISLQSWQSRQFGLRIRNDEAELRQLTALAQHGMLRSYLWWIEDKPAAFAVCNQHRGCFRYEEIAYCAEFAQFSPGRTMLHQIVEDLLSHDCPTCLDFGGGDAEYKQQFSNRESRSGTIWLVPPSRRARWTLSYLKVCRRLRSAGRELIKKAGLATRARQWFRSPAGSQATTTNSDADDAPKVSSEK